MIVTRKIKLLPTKHQEKILRETTLEYIRAVNSVVTDFAESMQILPYSSKDVRGELPSALRAQVVLDAKPVWKKHRKGKTESLPVLKKPVAIWNNQNYSIKKECISFPVWLDCKCRRISIQEIIPEELYDELEAAKLGTLRITKKSNKRIAQAAINVKESDSAAESVMGVDLGIKVPAVVYTEEGKVRFYGNGRENKYIRRKFKTKRNELGKAKKLNAIRRLKDKEQRWMSDRDHKISRRIIDFAKKNNVGVISLERLKNIKEATRRSRKENHSLHTWSFYRLSKYIEYKAKLEGIEVMYINPAYTSKVCSECGRLNTAKDRRYRCQCGFTGHRDIVGARNIMRAAVAGGRLDCVSG